ncbi:adenylate kinase [Candidatus Woesearchaeota archaeon]|nr:MAG: adenylate kinase [Candidatus Woesearchaeota archaeon]
MKRLILLGPPAAGKGSQAKKLSKALGIPHISTGDLLREEVSKGSVIGKKIKKTLESGDLVPDKIIVQLIKKRLENEDGFILDGFPRDIEQAKQLPLEIDHVILIDASDEKIIERVSKREICPTCGRIYGVDVPPIRKGLCDDDNTPLIHRPDDRPESIKHRLEVYHEKTQPLIKYYEDKLIRVNGDLSIDEVFKEIIKQITA